MCEKFGKKTLLKYIQNGDDLFSDDIKRQLGNRQRDLGLRPEDIEEITRPILDTAKAVYQERSQAVVAEPKRPLDSEAEPQRQLERQPLQEQEEYESKPRSYEEEFAKAVKEVYPLSESAQDGLHAFQQSLELNPEDPKQIEQTIREPLKVKYHLDLGKTLMDQWKLEEAIAEFQKVLQINPNNVDAYTNLGDALSGQLYFAGFLKFSLSINT